MVASTDNRTDFFYATLVALVIIAPFALVIATGWVPEGQRGNFIVLGHGVILAVVGAALVLRAVYAFGFRQALKLAAAERNYSEAA